MGAEKKSNFRWVICSLLFFATTVNYLDRQVLSLTYKDFIAPVFGWSDNDYGTITGVFSIVYAACNLFAGRFIDRLGTRKGYLWAIAIWSLGACLHAGCGAGATALVFQAGRLVLLDKAAVIDYANAHGIALVGVDSGLPAAPLRP